VLQPSDVLNRLLVVTLPERLDLLALAIAKRTNGANG